MKYYIIAGEASGDLHGSNLIKQIKLKDDAANIQCWGGDLMQSAGAKLIKHYRELAFMGFAEVVKNLPTIFKNLAFCKQDILAFKPDVLVLIDYPGFNLRIAKWAKEHNIKIAYYISPQVWAWKANRVKQMKLCIDKMLCIIPFEKDYYKLKWNWDVEYVGHPLVEVIEKFKVQSLNLKVDEHATNLKPDTLNLKPCIAVLPGSRKQEIIKKLPIMLEVAKSFPDYQFVVAKAPGLDDSFYEPFFKSYPNVSTVNNQTYQLLLNAKAAIVTSGTATLETALFGVPEVVCYKTSNISYAIGKRLVKIKFISLVNLIMNKLIVKELIQNELTTKNLVTELEDLLKNETRRKQLQEDYTLLWNKLAAGGNASSTAAKIIYNMIQ
ncbi:MAG: lipid-A-disaccharide synthase [Chitinophagaceae bacterium]